jgi:flavodoxin
MRLFTGLIAGGMLLYAGQLYAADVPGGAGAAPTVSPKKVLVVYYSRTGNTKKVAEDVARALNADLEQLVDKKDRAGATGYIIAGKDASTGKTTELEPVKQDPAQYDLVVLGTPVWAWNMTPALRTYIAAHKAAFREIAVFTSAGGTKPEKIVGKMEDLAGKKARAQAGFFDSDYKEKNRARYEEKLNAFVAGLR